MILLLKRFWRELLIVLLVIVASLSIRSCNNKNDKIRILGESMDSSFRVARFYVNRNHQLVAQVNTHQLTIKQLRKESGVLGVDKKKLKQQVGNLNNLVGYWKVKAEIRDTFKIHGTDTTILYREREVKAKSFNYSNKFLSLKQIYNPLDDSLATSYSYNPSFELIPYYKSEGLFKKPILVTDIKFADSNILTKEIIGIVIKPPKVRWFRTTSFKISLGAVGGIAAYKFITK